MIFIKMYFWLFFFFLIWDIAQIPTEMKVNQKFIVQGYSALVFSADTTNRNNDKPSYEGVFMMQISPGGEDYSHHEFISQFSYFLQHATIMRSTVPFL